MVHTRPPSPVPPSPPLLHQHQLDLCFLVKRRCHIPLWALSALSGLRPRPVCQHDDFVSLHSGPRNIPRMPFNASMTQAMGWGPIQPPSGSLTPQLGGLISKPPIFRHIYKRSECQIPCFKITLCLRGESPAASTPPGITWQCSYHPHPHPQLCLCHLCSAVAQTHPCLFP